MEELGELDQMTRKQMNIYKSLHPRSDIDRLYVPRKKGGRGLRSLERLGADRENITGRIGK